LNEFKSTPSGQLSVRDFRAVWLESEADPPAFNKTRKRVKHTTIAEDESNMEETPSAKGEESETNEKIENERDSQMMLPPKKRKRLSKLAEPQEESSSDKVDAREALATESAAEESSAADGSEKSDSTQSAKEEMMSNDDKELADELNSLMKDEMLLKEAEKYGICQSSRLLSRLKHLCLSYCPFDRSIRHQRRGPCRSCRFRRR
jgi:transcription factor IIIB subunit 2